MTRVRAPLLGGIVRQTEGLQQRVAREKNLILTADKDIRSHLSRLMINGLPEPTRVVFVADKRPPLLHLGFAGALNVHGHFLRVQCAQQRGVGRLQRRPDRLRLPESIPTAPGPSVACRYFFPFATATESGATGLS